ncbi:fibronectin type III domain-containing protein [Flavobacterium quisquiliarum]|uniref:Fibronectin type III domain-containing protein n=1 Tax=Flavobacterium quisquiliarum TaxID=1834436 RepID=A0ABV8W6T3_9FLAO|nr:fibronectin type III domain-containing protein [Flavobacterium quisquiliarum]MBW1656232.1 hypothetical protein [Flavobacterium quisquiliarum]NWL02075.1 hypothetical protein [Flavobacterium collinsii]
MLKKLQFQLFLTLGFWLSAIVSGIAQTYPVTISTQITQPSPIYLSNYADASTINSPIKVQIALNDLTISNRQIRLKCYFQGQSISLMTNDFVVGAHDLFLEGGVPLQLTNVDLAPYFQYQNLLGINPNQYAQALPEGIYTFSVEVYDFATNKKLSRKTSVTTIIFQNDPPFLNLPLNNASIMQQNIQNIIFSWTPRQINVSNVEYEFSLVEIWDKYTPIQNAFAYSPPLFTTTTRSTTLQYGVSEPQLIPGKRYAWRVKAKALLGAEEVGVFKNNGFSEIYSFDYEVFCTAPLAINVEGISENQAKVTWSGNIDNFDYQVNYREKNADSEWYKVVTPRENIVITNLKPNTTYEYTVGSSCDVGKYTHSTVKEFKTLVRDEIAFQGCGIKPDPADLANTTPLPALFPNDVISAGDFPLVVLHATGSNGTFSGDGYVTFPFIEKFRLLIAAADAIAEQNADEDGKAKFNLSENTRIRITFNNIGLNTDFKLISGEIIAAYDPNWNSMIDGDKIITDIFGNDGKPIEGTLDYVVKSATLNPDGSVTIKGENGAVTTLPKSPYERIYTDKNGNTVTIPANGKGEPTFTKAADGGKAIASNTNGVSSNGEVTQISSPDVKITFAQSIQNGSKNSKYAYDRMPSNGAPKILQTYETIPMATGGNYNVDYKAVSDLLENQDVVYAEANFKNGKTKDDIIFKTSAGEEVDFEWINDTQAAIKLTKKFEFGKYSIIATVKGKEEKDPQDATKTIKGKSEIAGKVNIWDLTQKPAINVTVLSINGANAPSSDKMQSYLNEVYNKVGIKFNVTSQKVESITMPDVIKCGDSDIFNFYTDDQKSIINQIETTKGFTYNDQTYYVIYTGKSGQDNYKGFMPLGSQYAFVFKNNDNDEILRTAAHELGHGIFGLKHPFSNSGESGNTDLLMDYGKGTVLSHNDWDVIHSGGWRFYGFQKSSSGAATESLFLTLDFKLDQDLNQTVFKFFDEEKSTFYYKGYKITFNQKNVRFDEANRQFTIVENNKEKKLNILYKKNVTADKVALVLCYADELEKVSKNTEGNYIYDELAKKNIIYSCTIEIYKNLLPVADLALLNEKIKSLEASKIKKIQNLLQSLPLNEIAEICGNTGKCYDIFNKQYTSSEWDEIIKFLENQKNQSVIDLERLSVNEQLLAIKSVLSSAKNVDKISRLNINAADNKTAFEYPDYFRIEHLGNRSGTNYIRVELLENLKLEKVERKFLLTYPANADIVNNDQLEFSIILETDSSQSIATRISKGTSVQVKAANAITNTVIIAVGALGTAELVAGITLTEEQIAGCAKSMALDAGIQAIADVLIRNFSDNEEGLPLSYTSLAVSCAMGTMTDITKLDACMAGAITPIGDAIIHNLTKKTPPREISTVALQALTGCVLATTLHMAFTNPTVQAKVRQAIKWVLIKNAIRKAKIPYPQRQAITSFLIKGEKFANKTDDFITAELLADILNNSSDDIAIIIQKLEGFMVSGNRVIKQGEEILVVDASNEIISKFKNGFWYSVENAVVKEATREIIDKSTRKIFKEAISNITSTHNNSGASIASKDGAYTMINNFNSQGNVSAVADVPNFNALIDGNNALNTEIATFLRIVKDVEEEVILLPKANIETGLITKADNIPVINLIPYKASYYTINGQIELIVASTKQSNSQAQVIFATANVLSKLKEKEKEEEEKCKACTKQDQATCKKFEQLITKVGQHAGITKLCTGLTAVNANPVITELLTWDKAQILLFLDDIAGISKSCNNNQVDEYIKDNIQNITKSILEAWSVYKDASRPCLCQSNGHLRKLAAAINSNKLRNPPYGFTKNDFKEIAIGIGTSGSSLIANLDKTVFTNLVSFAQIDASYANMDKLKAKLSQRNSAAEVEGVNFIVRHMGDNKTIFDDGNYVFESYQTEWARYVDVQDNRNLQNIIFYEFKSLIPGSFNPESFVIQFVKDLSNNNVTDLSQIQWIFDHDKMTQTQVKTKVLAALNKYSEMLDHENIRTKFENYRLTVGYNKSLTNNERLIEFLNSNNDWFNLIFK